jgi:hypothetical protein
MRYGAVCFQAKVAVQAPVGGMAGGVKTERMLAKKPLIVLVFYRKCLISKGFQRI